MPSLYKSVLAGCLGLCALGAAVAPAAADAIPYPNTGHIAPTQTFAAASTGDLSAYFYGSTASYDETLGIRDVTSGVTLAGLFPNHATPQGAMVDFGHVNAGDSLLFFINVVNTGETFYSDPSMNSDGINHAYATAYTGGVAGIPPGTFVGFEDVAYNAGSDLNYNDETFVFTNTMSSVPLPASAPMFGAALVALGAVGYGFKRKAKAAA